MHVSITVNGVHCEADVEPRLLLVDFIRETVRLTGTHVGCDTSNCGACTILFDGEAVKSCTVLAVQADGHDLTTIEGIGSMDRLHPVQDSFWEDHALQCGFCTPGMIMATVALLRHNSRPTIDEIKHGLEGNLCRCTGYVNIVKAVQHAAERLEAVAEPAAQLEPL
jgi:aerobic carbon-monoxide dehydrogenase small subunit